jgi:hypothetical protein
MSKRIVNQGGQRLRGALVRQLQLYRREVPDSAKELSNAAENAIAQGESEGEDVVWHRIETTLPWPCPLCGAA